MIVAGNHHLFVGSWSMMAWFKHRICNGNCSFLYFVLKFSQSKPSCFFAAFELERFDLVDLLASICIGEHKLFDSGVLQYTIRHLNKSFHSSLAL